MCVNYNFSNTCDGTSHANKVYSYSNALRNNQNSVPLFIFALQAYNA